VSLFLALAACISAGSGADTFVDEQLDGPPALTSFTVSCDPEAETWTVRATTDAWSGGADSVWTVDGLYAEQHSVPSVALEADGSGDTLRAKVTIVADWRESNDVKTAFLCGDDPSIAFLLYDPVGEQVACRFWGENPEVFQVLDDAPDCTGPTGSLR
jgi:hypothetical protein